MKEENKNRKGRLRILIFLVAFMPILISISTYVWLISIRTVHVTAFDVEIPISTDYLFSLKNPYIGDASANSGLLEGLGISNLGYYTMTLKTDEKPYILIISFSGILVEHEKFHTEMRKSSYILLALIDNSDEIHWNINDKESNSITIDDVNMIYGNIKDYGQSLEKLDELLIKIGYKK